MCIKMNICRLRTILLTVMLGNVTLIFVNAAPVDNDSATVTILKFENINKENGYEFSYETSDQQTRNEVGTYKTDSEGKVYLDVRGTYSYVSSDGQTLLVSYIAGKDGFRLISKPIPEKLPNSKQKIPEKLPISLVG
ncbi:endocuticle structural glycoprotein ABD-5-like [Toxorhynchites rutilus septentrionalis]|uniref:endocuticle structural glycoprotein ABD-5-like n=1 Tax=Toxorhynchites rutilus septentrionalis TaxID=329112 RepID=UPI002478579F|nr:endocuticle structural glycoprotein ABD-5-like [Toxorhynchites rutilus septentrionalis]